MEQNTSRVAATWLLAQRVADAWLRQAGILEAPPGMVESITEWVLAVVAASKIEDIGEQKKQNESWHRTHALPAWRKLEQAHKLEVLQRVL